MLDCSPTGLTGHDSTDGTKMSERMSKFGKWLGGCGENISYGMNSALAVLIQLIVDDGVPSRGHRTNFFEEWKVCGNFTGSHSKY